MKLDELVKGTPAQYTPPASDDTLDQLVNQKTRILRTKLEVMAASIDERLRIRRINLDRIGEDSDRVAVMIRELTRSANYLMREHKEKGALYLRAFDLEKERRDQDVECWRDVVLVLRDFLTFWDYHEQAQAKGRFLSDVR